MKDMPEKIRIKDIALMAGVSTGTVDRVLHNRGEVSSKSREKVEKVLKEINYQPNIYASALASKKRYIFAALLPESEEGEYWYEVRKGVNKASQEFLDLNIIIEKVSFSQYDSETFADAMNKIKAIRPDAVLLAPIFKEQANELALHLQHENIPYVFIDSDIEKLHPLAYFGMDSLQSGYLAAKLLLSDAEPTTEVAVFQVYRSGNVGSNQTDLRLQGFKKFISEYFPKATLYYIKIYVRDREKDMEILSDFITKHPHIQKGITFNSKVSVLADYFEQLNYNHIKLIGYDLLQKNVEGLKTGKVNYLLSQRPEMQSYRGMKALCEYKIFRNEIKRKNFMPIDILTKENIDYYTDFQSI